MWVEKNGIFGNSERRTQQWFKMVDPPGEARDDCWQTIAVAHRLYELGHEGMKDKDGECLFKMVDEAGEEVPIWEWDSYYDVNVDKNLFEEYREFTLLKHKNVAPYDELVSHRGLRWPVVETENGGWRRPASGSSRSTTCTSSRQGDPVLPLGHQGRPRADLVPAVRAAAGGLLRALPLLALHRAACSSTGTPAR